MKLDDRMKQLLREMGEAINDSLTASTELTATIERIRQEGYDIFLILEATIGLNPKAGDGSEPSAERLPASAIEITAGTADETMETDSDGKQEMVFQVSPDDEQFLRSLKISVDDSGTRSDDRGPDAEDDPDDNESSS